MKRTYFLLFIFFISSKFLLGQEMYGGINSTYSGINGITINPANMADSRLYLDVQLFASHIHAQNDFIYFDRTNNSFSDFVKNRPDSLDGLRVLFGQFEKYDKINGYINTRFNGPGVMFSFGKHAVAFSNAFRFIASSRNVPENIASLGFFGLNDSLNLDDFFEVEKFNIAGAAFEEISLSYSNIIINKNRTSIAFGASLKGLMGFGGVYFANDHILYDKVAVDSIYFKMDSEYGFALNQNDATDRLIKGGGVAIDLGIVIQKNTRNRTFNFSSFKDQKYFGYEYKLGFSIVDLGYIKYNNNTQQHVFEDASVNYRAVNALNFGSLYDYSKSLSYVFYQDSAATLKKNEFSITLPASASVQFDYYLGNEFFVNATFLQGLNFFKNQIRRPTFLAISPRWDNKKLQIQVPFALYNFRQAQLGFSFTYENVTIGTDRLAFWTKKMAGFDFYISAKISLTKNQPIAF